MLYKLIVYIPCNNTLKQRNLAPLFNPSYCTFIEVLMINKCLVLLPWLIPCAITYWIRTTNHSQIIQSFISNNSSSMETELTSWTLVLVLSISLFCRCVVTGCNQQYVMVTSKSYEQIFTSYDRFSSQSTLACIWSCLNNNPAYFLYAYYDDVTKYCACTHVDMADSMGTRNVWIVNFHRKGIVLTRVTFKKIITTFI